MVCELGHARHHVQDQGVSLTYSSNGLSDDEVERF
jgi:hypothetical protein